MTQSHVLALLNTAVGFAAAGYGLAIWFKARRTLAWPSVAGKVLGTHVAVRTSDRDGTQYFGHVDYEYTVGGNVYQGGRRTLGGAIPDSQVGAELLCSRYNIGDIVWVFYNPSDPTDAVLEHAAPAAWRWLVIGAALFGFAAWFASRATIS